MRVRSAPQPDDGGNVVASTAPILDRRERDIPLGFARWAADHGEVDEGRLGQRLTPVPDGRDEGAPAKLRRRPFDLGRKLVETRSQTVAGGRALASRVGGLQIPVGESGPDRRATEESEFARLVDASTGRQREALEGSEVCAGDPGSPGRREVAVARDQEPDDGIDVAAADVGPQDVAPRLPPTNRVCVVCIVSSSLERIQEGPPLARKTIWSETFQVHERYPLTESAREPNRDRASWKSWLMFSDARPDVVRGRQLKAQFRSDFERLTVVAIDVLTKTDPMMGTANAELRRRASGRGSARVRDRFGNMILVGIESRIARARCPALESEVRDVTEPFR